MAILVAVGGEVFDMTPGAAFYTRGASYAAFAGRAATRTIALSSLKEEDISDDVADFTPDQLASRDHWVEFYRTKYAIVGTLVPDTPEQRRVRAERRAVERARAAAASLVRLEAKRSEGGRLFSRAELAVHDGTDPDKPLLLAVGGHVLDVSTSSWLYGVGSPRHVYAGKAVTRAVTLQSVTEEDIRLADDTTGFGEKEMQTMTDRVNFYLGKFPKVGVLQLGEVRSEL